MEYITDDEIRARMAVEGRNSKDRSVFDEQYAISRAELEQEHLWRVYEVWDEALEALGDEPGKEQIALMLLRGWTDSEHISESIVCLNGQFYFNDWEITRHENQWHFEHCYRKGGKFFDVDLLVGLQICEQADRDPDAQREALIRKLKLNDAQVIQLDRFARTVAAATKVRAERQMIAEVRA